MVCHPSAARRYVYMGPGGRLCWPSAHRAPDGPLHCIIYQNRILPGTSQALRLCRRSTHTERYIYISLSLSLSLLKTKTILTWLITCSSWRSTSLSSGSNIQALEQAAPCVTQIVATYLLHQTASEGISSSKGWMMWSSTSTASSFQWFHSPFYTVLHVARHLISEPGSWKHFRTLDLQCGIVAGHCSIQHIHSLASGDLPALCLTGTHEENMEIWNVICWNPVRTFSASAPGVQPMAMISEHAKVATQRCSSWQFALMPCRNLCNELFLMLPCRVLLPHIQSWSATSASFLEHPGWKNCSQQSISKGIRCAFNAPNTLIWIFNLNLGKSVERF